MTSALTNLVFAIYIFASALTFLASDLTILASALTILESALIILTSDERFVCTTPTHKAIHICNSRKATAPPKIAKEYGFPTHTSELTLKKRN